MFKRRVPTIHTINYQQYVSKYFHVVYISIRNLRFQVFVNGLVSCTLPTRMSMEFVFSGRPCGVRIPCCAGIACTSRCMLKTLIKVVYKQTPTHDAIIEQAITNHILFGVYPRYLYITNHMLLGVYTKYLYIASSDTCFTHNCDIAGQWSLSLLGVLVVLVLLRLANSEHRPGPVPIVCESSGWGLD